MRGVKVFLAAVAIGTGCAGYYLVSDKIDFTMPSIGNVVPSFTATAYQASSGVPLTALDQDQNPVGGALLYVNYISTDGTETVSTVRTNSDGTVDVPAEDGTYIYTIGEVPTGYSSNTSKIIIKVDGGEAKSSQTFTIMRNDGENRDDAAQNAVNAADEVFGSDIIADLPTQADQDAADSFADTVASLDPTDEEAVSTARSDYNSLTNTQKKLVSVDTLTELSEAESDVEALNEDKKLAAGVQAKLLSLADVTSLDQAANVESAQNDYDALTDSQKKLVSAEATTRLDACQLKLDSLRKDQANAENTTAVIEALPEITSLDQSGEVQAARLQYDALSDSAKAGVSEETLAKLTGAEATITKLNAMKSNAESVTEKIEAIRTAKTDDQKATIEAARAAYDALSSEEKALVSDSTLSALETAENALRQYEEDQQVAKAFVEKVNAIGNVTSVSQKDTIQQARDAYNAMTQSQQSMISNETYSILQKAELKMSELVEADYQKQIEEDAVAKAKAASDAADESDAAAQREAEAKAQAEAAAQAEAEAKAQAEADAAASAAAAQSASEAEESSVKPAVLAGDIEGWRPWVIKALEANGLSTSDEMVEKVLRQIRTESGGDQNIVQYIVDSNSGWILNEYHCEGCATSDGKAKNIGHGLMQTIITTFEAYKFEGHDDIFNGYDNLLAALNYAKNTYGSNLDGLGEGHGY